MFITALLIISVGLYLASLGTTKSSGSSSDPRVISGDGEDYYTCLTYQSTVLGHPCPNGTTASIDASWNRLISNLTTSPTDYVAQYGWNTFKVTFAFQNLNTTNSSIHYLNLTLLDSVINTIHGSGFNVIIGDADFANFGSALWVQDWLQVTQHYKGNSEIQAFDLFEEPATGTWSHNVTTTNPSSPHGVESAYYNITKAIRVIDPSRTVIWYLGSIQYTLVPSYTMKNVEYDFHLDANAPDNNEFSAINDAYRFKIEYGVTVVCFELNIESRSGTNFYQTEAEISYMSQLGIGYSIWLYDIYTNYAIPILDNPYSGQWLPTAEYNMALSGQSCVSSGPTNASVLYCVGGSDKNGTDYNNSLYSGLNSGIYEFNVSDPWTKTTSYPVAVSNLECSTYSDSDYCVGGNSDGTTLRSVYVANLTSNGIKAWTTETRYPTNIVGESCFTASIENSWANLYCVGGFNGVSTTASTYYSSLKNGSLLWNSGNPYPVEDEEMSCASTYVNPWYAFCVGGKNGNTYTSLVYYTVPGPNGFGTWTATTSYPVPIADASCNIWNSTLYCAAGTTRGGSYSNTVYFAPLTTTGLGRWQLLTSYPEVSTDLSCDAISYWFDCLGGTISSGAPVSNAYALFLGYNDTTNSTTTSTTNSISSSITNSTTSSTTYSTTNSSTNSTSTTSAVSSSSSGTGSSSSTTASSTIQSVSTTISKNTSTIFSSAGTQTSLSTTTVTNSTFSKNSEASKVQTITNSTVTEAVPSFLGMSPKQVTAVTYGSSISATILALGGLLLFRFRLNGREVSGK
jgi:hypothetical protein